MPAICTDSNPATTRIAGMMVPMIHFVSLLMPEAYHGDVQRSSRAREPEGPASADLPGTRVRLACTTVCRSRMTFRGSAEGRRGPL